MRRSRISHGAVMALVFCVFLALLAVGLFVADKFWPSPDLRAFDAEQYYPDMDESPVPPVTSPDPEPPSETEPTQVAEPLDFPEPMFKESADIFLTSRPARMRIPALSLDYEIQGTGADESGTMQIVPALAVISWFELSSIPGNNGNAILGGHNSWGGVRSKIFTLDELEIGDEMMIDYADGTSLRFLLESVFVYELETAPANLIMNVRGEARVTLITCKGPFNATIGTSDNRIVAIFREESIFVIPDPPVEPFPPRILA